MTLLYLALTYLLGVAAGYYLWDAQWIMCDSPSWIWLVPLVALPFTHLLVQPFSRLQRSLQPLIPLRWPESAGFIRPQNGPSSVLLVGLLLCLVMGLLRYASHPHTPCWQSTDLAAYNLPASQAYNRDAPEVTITGTVSSYPLVADTEQKMQVMAETVKVDGITHDVVGELILKTGIRTRYVYGQPIRLTGRLVTPPDFEEFSYREYLATKGIHSQFFPSRIEIRSGPLGGNSVVRTLYGLRSRGERLINQLLPEPYAALANGMLLGIEAGIPDDLYDQFNLTGTSHVIVISGLNVSQTA